MTDESDASPQTFTAVLDRFEEEQAVLLLESDGETVDEVVMHRDGLPEPGRHQDAIFTVTIDGGTVVEIEYKPTETDDRAEAAQQQFDRLARRPPEDDTE
jgi:Fe2+ or Zn2+ uptake regulation protein